MRARLAALPLTIKAPLLVAGLMLGLSAIMTHAVLSRLSEAQERHVMTVATTYLDGLVSALQPYVLRSDTWEVFDAIERTGWVGPDFGRANLVVTNALGEIIAASDPQRHGVGETFGDRPELADEGIRIDVDAARAFARRAVRTQERTIGWVHADFGIAHLVRERADVLRTLLLTNGLIALILAGIGYLVIRRMLAPVAVLSRHLGLAAEGRVERIPEKAVGRGSVEFGRLFRQFDAMADAVRERQEMATRLAEEERLASLGKLASGMAHEINNPLGGLFNALDTLRRHGDRADVRRSTVDLIARGLEGIRDVVRTRLATYRRDPDKRELAPADLDDMRTLMQPELERRQQVLAWHAGLNEILPIPASPVRQIALNLLLNAAQASPVGSCIEFDVRRQGDMLVLCVTDRGPGMPPSCVQILLSPAGRRETLGGAADGLGLWVTGRLIQELRGASSVTREEPGLTRVIVRLPLTEDTMGARDAA